MDKAEFFVNRLFFYGAGSPCLMLFISTISVQRLFTLLIDVYPFVFWCYVFFIKKVSL